MVLDCSERKERRKRKGGRGRRVSKEEERIVEHEGGSWVGLGKERRGSESNLKERLTEYSSVDVGLGG